MLALAPRGFAQESTRIDASWFRRSRCFADLPMGRVAYVERGRGPAALFVHGYPLNGFQWLGALERLHVRRRCIAPDLLGTGFTQTRERQEISPATQATMLAMLLDALDIKDSLFGVEWAEWLDRAPPGSSGVRRVEGANLFFPEEMPGLIAEEATRLWNIPWHR